MKNKKNLIIISLLLVCGFLVYNYTKTSEVNIDKKNFNTYENIEYGYKFEYPKEANVVDGKDFPSTFNKKNSVVILLPEKYESLKDPHYIDRDEIQIELLGEKQNFGETNEEIIKKFSGKTKLLEQVKNKKNLEVFIFSLGQVYIVSDDLIYSIHLLRQDPSIFIPQGLSEKDILNLEENYNYELNILENIYSTFEIIK